MRIFQELADELFSWNTQAGSKVYIKPGVKVKVLKGSTFVGLLRPGTRQADGFFPKINEHKTKQIHEGRKAGRRTSTVSMLAFSLCIFTLKCGYISKIL